MGEAKRRKQLGLMPEVESREVTFFRDGTLEGDPLPPALRERLQGWAETGARWDARFRTSYIAAGLPRERLETQANLRAIPVPERMRLRLGLLSGSPAWLARELEENPDAFFEEDGQKRRQLSVRTTEYDLGGRWLRLPDFDPDDALRYLTQHPAVNVRPQGEEHVVSVWRGGERDGEVDVEPQPDAEHREALARVAREVLGEDDESWLEDHHRLLDDELSEENEPAPPGRRVSLLLVPAPLVLSPGVEVLERSGDMDILIVSPPREGYTQDSEHWSDYPAPLDRRDTLRALLEELGGGDLSSLAELLGQEALGQEAEADGPDPQSQTIAQGRTIDAEVVRPGAGESASS